MLTRHTGQQPGAEFRHPEMHVVAGCVVTGVDREGVEGVERVWSGQVPEFWGHYRLDAAGREMWVDDHSDRDAAIGQALACPRRCPVFEEVDGVLHRLRAG